MKCYSVYITISFATLATIIVPITQARIIIDDFHRIIEESIENNDTKTVECL